MSLVHVVQLVDESHWAATGATTDAKTIITIPATTAIVARLVRPDDTPIVNMQKIGD